MQTNAKQWGHVHRGDEMVDDIVNDKADCYSRSRMRLTLPGLSHWSIEESDYHAL